MNILVTAIGSFSADCVINNLKNNGHFVVGCDIYPSEWHAVSKDCNKVYKVPFSTQEKEYVDFLITICKQHNIEYVFPLTDLEIDVLNKKREIFENIGTILCIQSSECLNIARNKYKIYLMFKSDPLVCVPKTICSNEITETFSLPAIGKPINGRSSEGIEKIYCLDKLIQLKKKDNYLIQEYLEGSIYTVDYVRNSLTGQDFSIPREELLRTKNGAGTTVRVVPDKQLNEIVSYIGNKLGVNGCVNMEFIYHEKNYYLIDINPRFSAGVAFSNFIGYDMVTAHLNCFTNNKLPQSIKFEEQILCKRYKEQRIK